MQNALYPLKVHTSVQLLSTATNRTLQYDVLWQFVTGKYEEAAERGRTVDPTR